MEAKPDEIVLFDDAAPPAGSVVPAPPAAPPPLVMAVSYEAPPDDAAEPTPEREAPHDENKGNGQQLWQTARQRLAVIATVATTVSDDGSSEQLLAGEKHAVMLRPFARSASKRSLKAQGSANDDQTRPPPVPTWASEMKGFRWATRQSSEDRAHSERLLRRFLGSIGMGPGTWSSLLRETPGIIDLLRSGPRVRIGWKKADWAKLREDYGAEAIEQLAASPLMLSNEERAASSGMQRENVLVDGKVTASNEEDGDEFKFTVTYDDHRLPLILQGCKIKHTVPQRVYKDKWFIWVKAFPNSMPKEDISSAGMKQLDEAVEVVVQTLMRWCDKQTRATPKDPRKFYEHTVGNNVVVGLNSGALMQKATKIIAAQSNGKWWAESPAYKAGVGDTKLLPNHNMAYPVVDPRDPDGDSRGNRFVTQSYNWLAFRGSFMIPDGLRQPRLKPPLKSW